MSIYFGNDTVNDLYVGLTPVTKGYVGIQLFYNGENTIIDTAYEKYILNTQFSALYNTAEKPIKSAILKGNTLVNLVKNPSDKKIVGKTKATKAKYKYLHQLDTTKTYTLQFVVSDFNGATGFNCSINNGNQHVDDFEINGNGTYKVLTQSASGTSAELWFYWSSASWSDENTAIVSNIVFIEDDYTNVDIPYFEGMQSVKMPVLTTTGKNLFDTNAVPRMGSEYNDFKKPFATTIKPILILKPNTTYQINGEITQMPNRNGAFKFVDNNGVEIQGTYVSVNNTNGSEPKKIKVNNKFTTGNNGEIYFNTFPAYSQEDLDKLKDILNSSKIQIEEGVQATSYEPYKSNILTVNEDVELRGIGDVKDELNLLTGELTERVAEIVLDGSENWALETTKENTLVFRLVSSNKFKNFKSRTSILCDKMKVASGVDEELITLQNALFIGILKSKASTVEGLKAYLSQNPITVQYQLATRSIKTVDLSIVDQDGNNTKLSTFNDITHVTLSSEVLIPEAELEVATKNEEVLNTMSLEMDDISATQTTLEETSNTQSENVDATMMATTEIYEQLL